MEEIEELIKKIEACLKLCPRVEIALSSLRVNLNKMRSGEETIDGDYINALGKELDNFEKAQNKILS